MSKKVVGLIVATGIIIVLMILVVVAGLRLEKKEDVSNGQLRQELVDRQTQRNSSQQQSNANNQSEQAKSDKKDETAEEVTEVEDSNKNISLVEQAVKDSNKVNNQTEQTPSELSLSKSTAELESEVYEIAGVVKSVELLSNSNGVQAQYKVGIEIQVGRESFTLDYFTTSNSLNALQEGTAVIVTYQLTTEKEIVINRLSLKNS